MKISKYGDRVLETIEATIKEHYKTDKNSSSGNSTDSVKRRRGTVNPSYEDSRDEDDFIASTARSKKRVVEKPNPSVDPVDLFYDITDEDLDAFDIEANTSNIKANQNNGRVLPSW